MNITLALTAQLKFYIYLLIRSLYSGGNFSEKLYSSIEVKSKKSSLFELRKNLSKVAIIHKIAPNDL